MRSHRALDRRAIFAAYGLAAVIETAVAEATHDDNNFRIYRASFRDGESWVKRRGAAVFYRVLAGTGSDRIVPDASDFRLMDRKVVDALLRLPERSRFMKGLFAWVGFRSTRPTTRRRASPATPRSATAGSGLGGRARLRSVGDRRDARLPRGATRVPPPSS